MRSIYFFYFLTLDEKKSILIKFVQNLDLLKRQIFSFFSFFFFCFVQKINLPQYFHVWGCASKKNSISSKILWMWEWWSRQWGQRSQQSILFGLRSCERLCPLTPGGCNVKVAARFPPASAGGAAALSQASSQFTAVKLDLPTKRRAEEDTSECGECKEICMFFKWCSMCSGRRRRQQRWI